MVKPNKDVFYVHEKYARRMANRRFVFGVIVGAVGMFLTPIYKTCKEVFEIASNDVKKKHGYSDSDESEMETCDESDFV